MGTPTCHFLAGDLEILISQAYYLVELMYYNKNLVQYLGWRMFLLRWWITKKFQPQGL